MKHVMIDIETLSTTPNALILTIGAIKFDTLKTISNDIKKTNNFYKRIVIDTNNDKFDVDELTQIWWNNQEKSAKYEALVNPDRIPLKQALLEFNIWFGKSKYIWSNGSVFDIVILENAYKVCNIVVPWNFWNIRDVRTAMDMADVIKNDIDIKNPHHSLNDCHWQIKAVNLCYEKLFIDTL
jgi:hypothetical protein